MKFNTCTDVLYTLHIRMKIILDFVEDELDFLLRGGGVVSQLTGRVSCPWGGKRKLIINKHKTKTQKI